MQIHSDGTLTPWQDDVIITDPVSSDPASADYRVLWGHNGIGYHLGYLTDLGLDDSPAMAGTNGYDAFDADGRYMGYAHKRYRAARLLAARELAFRSAYPGIGASDQADSDTTDKG